jgi:hypothetical protein
MMNAELAKPIPQNLVYSEAIIVAAQVPAAARA